PDLRYGWTIDGAPAGTGPRWTYVPQPSDVGLRHVEVTVSGRGGAEHRDWTVRVKPARPPELVDVEPAPETITLTPGTPVRLRVESKSATPGEHLRTSWQVDGAAAGGGSGFTLRPDRAGVTVVRANVQSDLGTTSTREWRVTVTPPPEAAPPEPP